MRRGDDALSGLTYTHTHTHWAQHAPTHTIYIITTATIHTHTLAYTQPESPNGEQRQRMRCVRDEMHDETVVCWSNECGVWL